MSLPDTYNSISRTFVSQNPIDSVQRSVSSANGYIGSANVSNLSASNQGAAFAALGAQIANQNEAINSMMSNYVNWSAGPLTAPEPEPNKDYTDSPKDEDGLLASLFKLFVAILAIPKKFGLAFNAILNASAGAGAGIGGIGQIFAICVVNISKIFGVSVEAVIKHAFTFFDIIFKMPHCILVHLVKGVSAVLYNIFPLVSYIFWTGTGTSLMPMFEYVFEMLDEADNYMSEVLLKPQFGEIYMLKFPKEVTQRCYTCNGKPLRLDDVIDSIKKIGDAGTKFGDELTNKGGRALRPSVPYLLRAKRFMDKLNK